MYSFSSIVYKTGYTYTVDVDLDVPALFKKSGYIPVNAYVKSLEFKGTLIPRKDNRYVMYLNADIRKRAGIQVEDIVQIEIEYDPVSRELPIPEDLELILKEKDSLWEQFVTLTPSHRRELIQYLNEAKKPESRLIRINKIISHLIIKKPSKK